jgi:hypothetical protein
MFDRPAAGRAWFERTLPDQLTLGRPDQVAMCSVGVSHAEPGAVSHQDLQHRREPAVQVHYRASKVKEYFKEGRALSTETSVNDTRDFGIGRRLTHENWEALVAIGHQVNQRFLDHQLQACQCAPGALTNRSLRELMAGLIHGYNAR